MAQLARHRRGVHRPTGHERVLIGEVGVLDTAELAAYQRPDELHQSFFFEFLRAPWDAASALPVIDRGLDTVAASGSPVAWVLNNHDMPRSVTRYAGGAPGVATGDIELGLTRARAAALLMLALPGSAYIYQGEELGLPEVTDLPDHVLTDPMFHRTAVPAGDGTAAGSHCPGRQAEDALGFSPAGSREPPGCPSPTGSPTTPSTGSCESGESMLQLYREAIALRRRVPALSTGRFRWLPTEPGRAGLHARRRLRVRRQLLLPTRVRARRVTLLLGSDPEVGEKLPPDSAGWFLLEVGR